MTTYVCAFLCSALCAMVWTPVVIRLAHYYKVLDHPGLRKIHKAPIPRLGGIAIALPVLVMVAVVCALDNDIGQMFQANWIEICALLGGSSILLLVGLADDLRGMRARHKLLAQVLTALVVCALGVRLDSIGLGELGTIQFGLWTWPLTVFWIVGMTNAVNLIDGLDGLAAGIAAITVAVIAVVALTLGQTIMATLMLICLGVLSGYLVFNFNPARIFCGDSGTYFLGFFLGTSSLLTSTKSGTLFGLTLPLLAMGIPIFDTLFAILRRSLDRRPLFAPDKSHIHHRLLALGLSQRQVVIVLYSVTILIASFGMFMVVADDFGSIVIFLCLIVLLISTFRSVGAVRLREVLDRVKTKRALGREIHEEREVFQEAQLRMREATTDKAWWASLCLAAEGLGFAEVSLESQSGREYHPTLTWRDGRDNQQRCTEISIPVTDHRSGLPTRMRTSVYANGSIESVGRKVALFGRLVDAQAAPQSLSPGLGATLSNDLCQGPDAKSAAKRPLGGEASHCQ